MYNDFDIEKSQTDILFTVERTEQTINLVSNRINNLLNEMAGLLVFISNHLLDCILNGCLTIDFLQIIDILNSKVPN